MVSELLKQTSERGSVRSQDMGPQASWLARLWYSLCKVVVRCALVLFYRVRYTGVENVPREGGVLVVANHQSHLDPPLVGAGFPRQMAFLARFSLFKFGPFGWLITSLNAIPLDRERGSLGGMKETLRRLKRGQPVLIFPEGTRSANGQMAAFRPGFATLAMRANAAILPVSIEGAFQAWPRSRRFPRLGIIHVHYGPPLPPEQLEGRSEEELVADIELQVRAGIELIRSRPQFARR